MLERSSCYGPAELRMGATVSVYGRDFLIVDCDDFTRKWLLVRHTAPLCWGPPQSRQLLAAHEEE